MQSALETVRLHQRTPWNTVAPPHSSSHSQPEGSGASPPTLLILWVPTLVECGSQASAWSQWLLTKQWGVGLKDEGFIIFLSTGYQENNKLDAKLDIQILDGREERKTLGGRGGG